MQGVEAGLRVRLGAQRLATGGGRLDVILRSVEQLLCAELGVDHATVVTIDPPTGLITHGDPTLRPGDEDLPLRSRSAHWGAVALPAGIGRAALDEAGSALADLLRLTMLRTAVARPGSTSLPPALVLVHDNGRHEVLEPGARWLDHAADLDGLPSAIRAVAAAARTGDGLARQSVAAADGGRVVLHASLMPGVGHGSSVAIIAEGSRLPAMAPSVAAAFQRGEPLAAIDAEFYAPRREAGDEPSPYGWYLA